MIDHFEGAWAVCESQAGAIYHVPREALPAGAREGDVVVACGDGRLRLDHAATATRSARVHALHEKLFGKTE